MPAATRRRAERLARRRARLAGGRVARRCPTSSERLDELQDLGLYRRLRVISGPQGPRVVLDGKPVLLLCSNNYLGLADHPRVREAAADAAMRWGVGAGASRLVSGHDDGSTGASRSAWRSSRAPRPRCCSAPATWRTSASSARSRGKGEVVFSDELNHASIIDGCRLSQAETFVYRHDDIEHLAWGLRARRRARRADRHRLRLLDGRRRRAARRARRARPPPPRARSRSTRRTASAAWAPAGAARSPRPASSARSTSSSARSARRSAPTART